jgi:hypothetical protein
MRPYYCPAAEGNEQKNILEIIRRRALGRHGLATSNGARNLTRFEKMLEF